MVRLTPHIYPIIQLGDNNRSLKRLLYVWQWAKCFVCMILYHPILFTDEKTEALRDWVTFPKVTQLYKRGVNI